MIPAVHDVQIQSVDSGQNATIDGFRSALRRWPARTRPPPRIAADLSAIRSIYLRRPTGTTRNASDQARRAFGDAGADRLCRFLPALDALAHLEISNVSVGERGLTALAQTFATLRAAGSGAAPLKTLLYRTGALLDSPPCAAALAQWIDAVPTLHHLSIGPLGARGASVVLPHLTTLTCLRTLDLANNVMSDRATCALADALPALAPTLTALDLSNNAIGATGYAELAGTLGYLSTLRVLASDGNHVGGVDGAAGLARALSRLPALEHLSLDGAGTGDGGAAELAEAFPGLRRLSYLSLRDNYIAAGGAAALAAELPTLTLLRSLRLSGNWLLDEGAAAVADALATLHTLTGVSLSRAYIGDGAARVLAAVLQQLPCLQIASLADNAIGPEGLAALARCTGFEIDVSGNSASEVRSVCCASWESWSC